MPHNGNLSYTPIVSCSIVIFFCLPRDAIVGESEVFYLLFFNPSGLHTDCKSARAGVYLSTLLSIFHSQILNTF